MSFNGDEGTVVPMENLKSPQPREGWAPFGNRVAGARDAVTGQLERQSGRRSIAATLEKILALAGGMAVVAVLYFGQDVLVPITLAIMLSFILSPMVNLLRRLRLRRAPAVIFTVLAALGFIGAFGTLIGMQAASLSINAPEYARAIETKVGVLQTTATQRINALTKALGGGRVSSKPPIGNPLQIGGDIVTHVDGAEPRLPVIVDIAPPKTTPWSVAKTLLEPIIGPLETTLIVLMVAIFVLLQKEDLRDRFIRVFGSSDLHRTTLALDDAAERLSRYFIAQLAVNSAFGIVVGTGLWLFGVPSPVMWGVLAAILRFVPYIGPVLAAVAPVALGAAIDPGWATVIYIALFFVVVESFIGYVVEPMLYGHSTGLSPVSVIISAIFWTWLWGPTGLILSTPLTLCLVVLGRHVKALEVFDIILGDRPALTQVESFYQRLLAGNTDEALAQAEAMLAETTLLGCYDTVVLPSLKLAAADVATGALDAERISQMTRTLTQVTDDLAGQLGAGELANGFVDEATAGQIACIAGRGSFDDNVANMLAQVLDQRGVRSLVIDHEAASRRAIGVLELEGVEVIVVSYLELSGSPAHLRFLLRRLREKAPEALIIVGLWPQGDTALSDEAIQATIGADRYVQSLSDAVGAVADHVSNIGIPADPATQSVSQ